MEEDAFALNIGAVNNLIASGINKTAGPDGPIEGVEGDYLDVLDLPMSDDELIDLSVEWLGKHDGYYPKVKPRQEKNKVYYVGKQRADATQTDRVVSSNLIFQAEETFIPQALSKNPEPVVFSDNTEEGKLASNGLKTMLQYHADVLCLRRKLGVMVRHWSIYFMAVVKHGWDTKVNDIKTEIRKPQNFIVDPDGYIDEYGNYVGAFLGEKIESSAQKLMELYPKHKAYILIKCDGKLGTQMVRTEWWTDDYCFTTFQDKVLEKHKNEYFNYDKEEQTKDGILTQSATPGINHFGTPKMPYTFLSVFSLQERPHDITNLIEQSIPNQDKINDRDRQIDKNLANGNNSIVLSKLHGWNSENAAEGAQAIENGDPILGPGEVDDRSIRRLPAAPLPSGVLESQQRNEDKLMGIFGTTGLSAQPNTEDQTARGMILNQSHDSSRIGGGIGDALEQVADNIFNWWVQLYYVFYDEPHYGAIMGNGQAVEQVKLQSAELNRHFVISVAPNSMQPKDEVSQMNQALERWNNQAIDPIGFMKEINDPDPMNSAKRLVLWSTNPQAYAMTYFPEQAPPMPPGAPNPEGQSADVQVVEPQINQEPASAQLDQVPINNPPA